MSELNKQQTKEAIMENLINDQQLMQMACISRTTMWRLRQAGLPCVRIGRGVRYKPSEAMSWIIENGHTIAPKFGKE